MPRALLPVYLTVFLDLVGFGMVIPLLTYFALQFEATPAEVGWLMACYSLAQFVFTPMWGALSDRIGRRPVMLVSIAATAVGLAAFASSTSLWMLFLFRTLHGVATANIATAQAAVADMTTPENRARGMGMIGAAFGVGFTVGPFLGGELSRFGIAVPFWVAAGLSAVNFVMTYVMLPETRKEGSEAARRPPSATAMFTVLRHPVVGLCVGLTFVNTVAFALMESAFTLFADHRWHLSAMEVGRMFGISGLLTAVVQGGMIGRLVKRFGERRLVPAGVLMLAVGLGLLPMAPPFGAMVGVFALISIGQSISTPSLNALISKGTAADEQGFVLGTNQSLSALGRVIGPSISGVIFQSLAPEAPFWLSAGILGLGFLLSLAAVRRHAGALPDGPT